MAGANFPSEGLRGGTNEAILVLSFGERMAASPEQPKEEGTMKDFTAFMQASAFPAAGAEVTMAP